MTDVLLQRVLTHWDADVGELDFYFQVRRLICNMEPDLFAVLFRLAKESGDSLEDALFRHAPCIRRRTPRIGELDGAPRGTA